VEFGTGFIFLIFSVVIFLFLTPAIIYKVSHYFKNNFGKNSANCVKVISADKLSKKAKVCL
jgi:hypothetical protein